MRTNLTETQVTEIVLAYFEDREAVVDFIYHGVDENGYGGCLVQHDIEVDLPARTHPEPARIAREPKAIKRCACGYRMPCAKTVPVNFCRQPIPARIARQVACRKCGGAMAPGKALEQTYRSMPEFDGVAVVTVSPGGPGRIVDCSKCTACGWSTT